MVDFQSEKQEIIINDLANMLVWAIPEKDLNEVDVSKLDASVSYEDGESDDIDPGNIDYGVSYINSDGKTVSVRVLNGFPKEERIKYSKDLYEKIVELRKIYKDGELTSGMPLWRGLIVELNHKTKKISVNFTYE